MFSFIPHYIDLMYLEIRNAKSKIVIRQESIVLQIKMWTNGEIWQSKLCTNGEITLNDAHLQSYISHEKGGQLSNKCMLSIHTYMRLSKLWLLGHDRSFQAANLVQHALTVSLVATDCLLLEHKCRLRAGKTTIDTALIWKYTMLEEY